VKISEEMSDHDWVPKNCFRFWLWRQIEPFLTGNLRGYLGAWIIEGRMWRKP
jgi:hypothetical protein